MSALNNPPGATGAPAGVSNDEALKTLRAVMLDPGRRISETMLRMTGVDVDMLEATYNQAIRPYLSYLDGYKDIRDLDPWDSRSSGLTLQVYTATEPWDHVLMRSGVTERTVDTQTLLVVNGAHFYCSKRELELPSAIKISIFLTRKGQWVLWYATVTHNRSSRVTSERVFWFETLRDMWEELHKLVPDDYALDYYSGGAGNVPGYLPLFIESKLRALLGQTIEVRQGRLVKMMASLDDARARISTLSFSHHP